MGDSGDDDPHTADAALTPSAAELEAAGQSAMFGQPPPPPKAVAAETAQPYRVLARKYRPQTFSQLLGQNAMVQTLANAIDRERLAHAFLMTGVRGVGKTSTARLIAKALNCIGPDGQGGPTIDPCGLCEPCVAIAEGRHIDVIEMDAASHTGVDDVREIVEAVRYAAVSARYKIYIIDEVHMLSRNAFNALLKTLEEPPPHVKFLFATTEVDKLPVTVLSRCQRFDLRRIPKDLLEQQFASICRQEGVEAEPEALAIIASAAEGSSRDGLSILDQAIAHADSGAGELGGGAITAERVRDMLGLADKSALRRLFSALLEGEPKAMLEEVERQYAFGVEPLALLRSLMELTHRIAVTQVGEAGADAPTVEERQAIEGWAGRLSAGQVHRLWQLLLKGHDEVRGAPDPLVAAQMALLRALHAADLPDPGTLAKQLGELAANGVAAGGENDGLSDPTPKAPEWKALVDSIEKAGELNLANQLRMQVRVIRLEPNRLEFRQREGFTADLAPALRDALFRITDQRWQVEQSSEGGAPSLVEQAEADEAAEADRIRNEPLVQAALAAFPEAEFVTEAEPPAGERNWSRH